MRKTRTYPRFNENAPESMRTDSIGLARELAGSGAVLYMRNSLRPVSNSSL